MLQRRIHGVAEAPITPVHDVREVITVVVTIKEAEEIPGEGRVRHGILHEDGLRENGQAARHVEPSIRGKTTRESWDRHMGSNLRAPFVLTQAFARQAPKADRSGAEPRAQALVVNMIDQRVLKPTPEFMTYSLAKAGLWWLTQTSAQALAPDIRVNAIGPELQRIQHDLENLLNPHEDRLHIIALDPRQQRHCLGQAQTFNTPFFSVV